MQRPRTAVTMERGHSADINETAPKKKQEKMNLGEFLTNQCEYIRCRGLGAHCTCCHCNVLPSIPEAHEYDTVWVLTACAQRWDHGPTRWTLSRCRLQQSHQAAMARVIEMAASDEHSHSQHGSRRERAPA